MLIYFNTFLGYELNNIKNWFSTYYNKDMEDKENKLIIGVIS